MTTRASGPENQGIGAWEAIVGWFIDNRLVVFVLALMLAFGGVYVAPFDWSLGPLNRDPVPVDAIPDIGENQQIIFTEWPGRSPRDVEDQITYPLTTALLGIAGVRTVRSASALGFSTIYVIFKDEVDYYWSRSRVLEKLSSLPGDTLPDGVAPTLGPDATALGQIFWYTLEGRDEHGRTVGGWDQDELRSIQDWTVRFALQSVEGVSEVASIGGFVREYQVDVDPEAMRAHGVTLAQVAAAVRESNLDVGARTLEINRVEYLVRGLGLVQQIADLEAAVVLARAHTPIRIRDVAKVTLGPAFRRGALDDEGAPAVGGVVVARFRENPLAVISALKAKIAAIQPGLPRRTLSDGSISQVTIVPFYDRTTLIHETLGTLATALFQEILVTILVVLIMLRNLRSSFLITAALPLGVLGTFITMKVTGVDANIMALGGIAIAIGTMVDVAIVFVENMNQHLERAGPTESRATVLRRAAAEVAPAVTTSVLTTIVSFLPVFGLSAAELRLFGPLAFTKTFAMGCALFLGVAILPAAAWVVLRRHPGPVLSEKRGLRRVVHSVARLEHARDWLLVALGIALLFVHWIAGVLVTVLGAYRLARPLLGDATNRRFTIGENALAALTVTWLLATNWLPLGRGQGLALNLLFVGLLIVVVMGSFRFFQASYPRLLAAVLRHKKLFLLAPLATLVFGMTAWLGFNKVFGFIPTALRAQQPLSLLNEAFPGFGREYMPPFDEGSFLYMPSTMPHASIGQALTMLSEIDAAIVQIPEVDRVVGKLGRVDSALDPAPISMIETVITYKPEYGLDETGRSIRQWRDHIHSPRDIWEAIIEAAKRPGLTSAPVLMPIQARLVMLQSGMRAPMGIKIQGPSLAVIERFGLRLESILRTIPSVRPETVFAERVVGKPYLEIDLDREAIGRYGLSVADVQQVLQVALGGVTLTRTVEGRERYPVRVRYMREERDSLEGLERTFVPSSSGEPIPLSQLATIAYVRGPQMIRSEDTFLTSYVLFDRRADVAEVEAVDEARATIEAKVTSGDLEIPEGVSFSFAGLYENQVRSEKRLLLLVPIALGLVFILLYLQFHRVAVSAIIYSGVAVAASGGFALLWLYGQPWFLDFAVFGTPMRGLFQVDTVHMSVAVWIGLIALVGVATDDGVVMSTYLKQRFTQDPPRTIAEVRQRTQEAGERRVRPCLMTTATTLLALLPVITSHGRGADLMVPLALPLLGGMLVELMTLFIVPVLYCALEERKVPRQPADERLLTGS